MAESLPPVEEWPDYNVQPLGANPLEQDVNAPYNKVGSGSTYVDVPAYLTGRDFMH